MHGSDFHFLSTVLSVRRSENYFPQNEYHKKLESIRGISLSLSLSLLEHSEEFYKTCDNLSFIPGAVAGANSNVESFNASSCVDGESWSVMQVAPPLGDLEVLKLHVNWVQQLEF